LEGIETMNDEGSNNEPGSKTWLERLAQALSGEPSSRSELIDLLRDAERRQVLDSEALSIIEGALQVSDMRAREIMIPRCTKILILTVPRAI
jgi:magnesium and cobalt transporter